MTTEAARPHVVIAETPGIEGTVTPRSRVAVLGPFRGVAAARAAGHALAERHGIANTVVPLYGVRRKADLIDALTREEPKCSFCCGTGRGVGE